GRVGHVLARTPGSDDEVPGIGAHGGDPEAHAIPPPGGEQIPQAGQPQPLAGPVARVDEVWRPCSAPALLRTGLLPRLQGGVVPQVGRDVDVGTAATYGVEGGVARTAE